jgi:predicted nuclease of restriction endonuclease-like RecB superfamily
VLPLDLLRIQITNGRVALKLLNFSYEELAKEIIDIYSSVAGKKERYGEILRHLEDLEEIYDYKIVRGLKHVLDKLIKLSPYTSLDPKEIRKFLFSREPVLSEEERKEKIRNVSRIFNSSEEVIEKSIWGDLKENMRVEEFTSILPKELIRRYNLSLAQSLLLRAVKLKVRFKGSWKDVIWETKRLGLLYDAGIDDKGFYMEIYGPVSIIKLTEKYGRNLGILLSKVAQKNQWEVEGEAILGRKNKRIVKFEFSSSPLFPERMEESPEVLFDSSVEEEFYNEVRKITSWEVRREPEPLVVNGKVFLPDFSFKKANKVVYFEIIGFWTEEYLRKKVNKLSSLGLDILIAIDESLIGKLDIEKLNWDNVIIFRKKVPIKPVLDYLRKIEEEIMMEAKIEMKEEDLKEVNNLRELSQRLGVPLQKVIEYCKELRGYKLVGAFLIREELLVRARTVLERSLGKRLSEVMKELSFLDGALTDVIDFLGYKLIWKGIDIEKSIISKRE